MKDFFRKMFIVTDLVSLSVCFPSNSGMRKSINQVDVKENLKSKINKCILFLVMVNTLNSRVH